MLCQRPYLLQKQHKNYILYSLLLLYLLIIIKQRYGKAEQQSFRAAGVHQASSQTRPSVLLLHAPFWTRPFCTTAPCPHLDEALLHYCSMPPFGRGPSALLLLALYRTRPLLQELFLLQIKPSAEPTTLHAERHCKQTIITYQHMKLSCNIQLEL
jgi:hypothetical protein